MSHFSVLKPPCVQLFQLSEDDVRKEGVPGKSNNNKRLGLCKASVGGAGARQMISMSRLSPELRPSSLGAS